MQTQTLNDIAEQLISEIGSESYSQLAKVLRLLANGRPVTVREVAEELALSLQEAKQLLTSYGGEFDNNGDLLGLGLTLVPTPHRFEVDGHKLYAWCATDTLLFPALLNRPAKVETVDPVTGAKIRLAVTPGGVEVEPADAVLTWSNYLDTKDVRGSFCNVGHWFASRQSGDEYALKHKGVIVLTPAEVRGVLSAVAEKAKTRSGQEERTSCGAGHEKPRLCLMARIVGLTNERTRNQLVLSTGQEANVRCGADILLTGMYHDLRAEAVCPTCGSRIEVKIEDRKVVSVLPQSASLHYVVDDEDRLSICCGGTFLFDRKQCLADWLRSYEGRRGGVVSPQAFMNLAVSRRGGRHPGAEALTTTMSYSSSMPITRT